MKEIKNWKVHNTFQEVANEGTSTMSVRRVVTKKTKKETFIKRDSLHAVLKKLKTITSEQIRQHVAKKTWNNFIDCFFCVENSFIRY